MASFFSKRFLKSIINLYHFVQTIVLCCEVAQIAYILKWNVDFIFSYLEVRFSTVHNSRLFITLLMKQAKEQSMPILFSGSLWKEKKNSLNDYWFLLNYCIKSKLTALNVFFPSNWMFHYSACKSFDLSLLRVLKTPT